MRGRRTTESRAQRQLYSAQLTQHGSCSYGPVYQAIYRSGLDEHSSHMRGDFLCTVYIVSLRSDSLLIDGI